MAVKDIYYSSIFAKSFSKIPASIRKKASEKEKLFRKKPLDPQLKTHPLSGRMKGLHSFSVSYRYRIVFKFETDGNVTFIDIGTHSIYR